MRDVDSAALTIPVPPGFAVVFHPDLLMRECEPGMGAGARLWFVHRLLPPGAGGDPATAAAARALAAPAEWGWLPRPRPWPALYRAADASAHPTRVARVSAVFDAALLDAATGTAPRTFGPGAELGLRGPAARAALGTRHGAARDYDDDDLAVLGPEPLAAATAAAPSLMRVLVAAERAAAPSPTTRVAPAVKRVRFVPVHG